MSKLLSFVAGVALGVLAAWLFASYNIQRYRALVAELERISDSLVLDVEDANRDADAAEEEAAWWAGLAVAVVEPMPKARREQWRRLSGLN